MSEMVAAILATIPSVILLWFDSRLRDSDEKGRVGPKLFPRRGAPLSVDVNDIAKQEAKTRARLRALYWSGIVIDLACVIGLLVLWHR
jgi:hypothetical protein